MQLRAAKDEPHVPPAFSVSPREAFVRPRSGAAYLYFGPSARDIGEIVHFNWTANGMVNITLYADPNYDNPISSWNFSASTGEVTWTPQATGLYEVDYTGGRARLLAVGTFFVVPAVPFGPILSIGACVAALGIAVMLRPRYKMQ